MSENQLSGNRKFIEEAWFRDSGEEIVMVGSKCETCNKVFFPKKEVCPDCFGDELKEVALSKRGRLHSYAISIMGLPDIEKPYVIGFIDLPEGIKIFSILTDCQPWDEVLKIGMEMEMLIGKIREDEYGDEIISYKFKPINRSKK